MKNFSLELEVALGVWELNQFKNKEFQLVADILANGKTQKVSEIVVYLHSQLQRFFAYVSLNFSNSNYRCMTFAHVAILLSFMQLVDESLVTLKDFNYFCSLGSKVLDLCIHFTFKTCTYLFPNPVSNEKRVLHFNDILIGQTFTVLSIEHKLFCIFE